MWLGTKEIKMNVEVEYPKGMIGLLPIFDTKENAYAFYVKKVELISCRKSIDDKKGESNGK